MYVIEFTLQAKPGQAVNRDPQFAAFDDAIAPLIARPPDRVELALLHSFARG
ncbi:MAG: hypothetical protein ACRDWD_02985 [Acidimicrobiia bacterium]